MFHDPTFLFFGWTLIQHLRSEKGEHGKNIFGPDEIWATTAHKFMGLN
jgi:hypothetical protein